MWCSRQALHLGVSSSSTSGPVNKILSARRLLEHGVRFLSQGGQATNVSSDEVVRASAVNRKSKTKVLKVALIGRPNVGKSTLVNQIVGRTICPVSMKAHTTRVKVKAFVNNGDTQVVFLDTPGIVSPTEVKRYKFDSAFLRSAEEAIQEADIVGIIHDSSYLRSNGLDPLAIRLLLLYQKKNSILILNKVDAVKHKSSLLKFAEMVTRKPRFEIVDSSQLTEQEVTEHSEKITSWPYFSEVFMISALQGDGVGDIKEFLLQEAMPGPWVIKENQETLKPHILAVDLVKAACLDFLPDEVPYRLKCKLGFFEDYGEKCAVEVIVVPANMRHSRMVMDKIRPIAAYAESGLASALEKECRLRLTIETKEEY